MIDGIHVDFAYPDRHAAVIVEAGDQTADTMALLMAGWNVVRITADDDVAAVVAANPSVFGSLE